MPAAINEKTVLGIWADWLRQKRGLQTAAGEPVDIIYPGRPNDDRGADFKDAVITTGRGRLKGDIEIHVNASDWRTHGHHLDPAYNRVILHVVYRNDGGEDVILENGTAAPTAALTCYRPIAKTMSRGVTLPCRSAGQGRRALELARALDEAGEARFKMQAVSLAELAEKEGAGQALYTGIMTALGYTKNKAPMARLAQLVPLATLESAAQALSATDFLIACQARLLAAAGLRSFIGAGEEEPSVTAMSRHDWCLFKVRPGNHPVRRLAAMAHLLWRYRRTGLLAGLEGVFYAAAAERAGGCLEAALYVGPDKLGDNNQAYGPPTLLGRERAAEIVVNILLPFFSNRGAKALDIYRAYRAPAENALVRHMRSQLGAVRRLVSTAARQQGLLHIYKTFCVEGLCEACPLNE